ncbi:MAG: hypothetical protein IPH07_33365 [Deltaproteobacteria bacterium]|nr:hypothetical protein [Deltaproteobacteria bacterium]MBK8716613.1 hypothetical protein [Deltaproteobacteria bacterium]MBP7290207.1 hypothetical protein [Nannocystaceae bacterium]
MTLAEFERRHELGSGRLRWWKRRVATEGTRGAVKFVPMLASEPAVVAEVVVHVGEVEIEVRADRVSAQWLAQLVSEMITLRPKT